MGRLLSQDPMTAMQGLSIKDAELQQVLSHTWKALVLEDQEVDDTLFDFARTHTSLAAPKGISARPASSDSWTNTAPPLAGIAFNDLLFPSTTALSLAVNPPLDLFITEREVEIYSSINSYILATRRAQLRLSDMWRRSSARREHRKPKKKEEESTEGSKVRSAKRSQAIRKVWATCSAAIFLISETAAYFEGEIIKGSCDHFEDWVQTPVPSTDPQLAAKTTAVDRPSEAVQRDPETLAAGHRVFLAALTYALLLTDTPYTRALRSLVGNVDALIAFFTRLLDLQQRLDLEADAELGGAGSGRTRTEEVQTELELDRARKRVDSDLKSVVQRLRQLDQERIGAARYLDVVDGGMETGGYEVWKGAGGLERLLMKLEFGRMLEGGIQEARLV